MFIKYRKMRNQILIFTLRQQLYHLNLLKAFRVKKKSNNPKKKLNYKNIKKNLRKNSYFVKYYNILQNSYKI